VNAHGLSWSDIALALVIIVVAILSKMLGAGLGARWGGFSSRKLCGSGGHGVTWEVGLNRGNGRGRRRPDRRRDLASVVLMVLATTLVAPILLRALYKRIAIQAGAQGSR